MNELVNELASKGVRRSFRKNALLVQEGEEGDEIFIILTGEVRAFSADNRGKEITHAVYGPGEYVGEMSLDGSLRSANIEATKATTCAVISRKTLRTFIQECPDFAFALIGQLIAKVRLATETATTLALSDVYNRIASFFNKLLGADSTGLVPLQLSHQHIANHIGCSREMVSRIMKDLEEGGYVEKNSKQIRLLKPLPKKW
jgi:CRP/FNR family transcriptional regulator, cyclic AMP receptor protein